MKNREIIMRRLEKAEGDVEKLKFALRRGLGMDEIDEILIRFRENIQDAKAFIEQEPLGPGEINRY